MHVYKPRVFIFSLCIEKKCNDDDVILCIGLFRDIFSAFAEINAFKMSFNCPCVDFHGIRQCLWFISMLKLVPGRKIKVRLCCLVVLASH